MRSQFPGRRVRSMFAAFAAIVGFAAVAFAQGAYAPPAMADSIVTLVAVGSETTQDVYNQLSVDAGGNLLDSFNATNPVTGALSQTIAPTDGSSGVGCSFVRPDGSLDGMNALQSSMNPNSTLSPLYGGYKPQPGCVDIARSNFSTLQQDYAGPIVAIPFAQDAFAGATGPANCTGTPNPCAAYGYTYTEESTISTTNIQNTVSATPARTAITTADQFTKVDLVNLYSNCIPVTAGGVTYDPTGSHPADTKIDLYFPANYMNNIQSDFSPDLEAWAELGFNPVALPTCVHDEIVAGPLATATGGVPVMEDDGTAVATDPNGFGPFSIAQWIGQRNGHDDRRHAAVVHNLEPCTGITGNPASGTCTGTWQSPFSNDSPVTGHLNTSFPIGLDVYSVVPYARVTNTSDPLYSLLNNASASNTLCNDQATIIGYGFALLSPSVCGEVIDPLRGDD